MERTRSPVKRTSDHYTDRYSRGAAEERKRRRMEGDEENKKRDVTRREPEKNG